MKRTTRTLAVLALTSFILPAFADEPPVGDAGQIDVKAAGEL